MVDRGGRTPLHYAAAEDRADDVLRLLADDVDPNAQDRDGRTALHFAAQEFAVAAANALIDAGADVDITDKFGNTPLFTAAFNSRGRAELIRLLRAAGADPNHANNAGQTPAGLAGLIGNYDVAQHFANASTRVTSRDAG
jgi:ankyrin repeat protein